MSCILFSKILKFRTKSLTNNIINFGLKALPDLYIGPYCISYAISYYLIWVIFDNRDVLPFKVVEVRSWEVHCIFDNRVLKNSFEINIFIYPLKICKQKVDFFKFLDQNTALNYYFFFKLTNYCFAFSLIMASYWKKFSKEIQSKFVLSIFNYKHFQF